MQFSLLSTLLAGSAVAAPHLVRRDTCSGPGALVVNQHGSDQTFYFFQNDANGYGVISTDNPYTQVTVPSGGSKFVQLDTAWKGRVQRSNYLPATWVEFQVRADNDGKAHGDVSLEQGCNGAAEIASGDNSSPSNGYNFDIVSDAPAAILQDVADGKAIVTTEGNYEINCSTDSRCQQAIDYENSRGVNGKVYVKGGTGVPDVSSGNNCLIATFY